MALALAASVAFETSDVVDKTVPTEGESRRTSSNAGGGVGSRSDGVGSTGAGGGDVSDTGEPRAGVQFTQDARLCSPRRRVQDPLRVTRRTRRGWTDPEVSPDDFASARDARPRTRTSLITETLAAQDAERMQAHAAYFQKLELEKELQRMREELGTAKQVAADLRSEGERVRAEKMQMGHQHRVALQRQKDEYQRELHSLAEQLATSRGMEKAAVEEVRRATEEFDVRKVQMMQLLDDEKRGKDELLQEYRVETEGLLEEQQQRIRSLESKLKEWQAEGRALSGKLESSRRDLADANAARAEAAAAHTGAIAELQQRLDDAEQRRAAEAASSRDEKLLLQAEAVELQKQVDAAQAALDDVAKQSQERLAQEVDRFDRLRADMADRMTSEAERLALEADGARMEKEAAAEEHAAALEEERSKGAAAAARLRRELEDVRSDKQRTILDLQERGRQQVAAADTHHEQLRDEAEEAGRRAAAQTRALKQVQSELRVAVLRNEQLERELEGLRQEQRDAEARIRSERRAAATRHESQVRAVRSEQKVSKQQLQSVADEASALSDENRRLRDALATCEAKLASHQEDARLREERLVRESAARTKSLQSAGDEAARQLEHADERRLELEDQLVQLRLLNEQERQKAQKAAERAAEEEAATHEMGDEVAALRLVEQKLLSLTDEQRRRMQDLHSALQDRESQLRAATVGINRLREQLKESAVERDRMQGDAGRLSAEWDEAKAVLEREHAGALDRLRSQINALRGENTQLSETVDEDKMVITKLRREVKRSQLEAIDAQEQLRCHADSSTREQSEISLHLQAHIDDLNHRLADAASEKLRDRTEIESHIRQLRYKVQEAEAQAELERADAAAAREEVRVKESVLAERQSTIALLQCRVDTKNSDVSRLDSDVREVTDRLHEAQAELARREMEVTQLHTRLRITPAP
eukprot:TRINITY_DN42960_c0_g1_i1.p1 TRINITY_DN42960_c0_g1~~TRINITY_DN42960_c0_g1_i1.p1  ORF type:complete len:957 (+),score=428.69 TRINITY_DN42960_c0_g1_i1:56-2872(+)